MHLSSIKEKWFMTAVVSLLIVIGLPTAGDGMTAPPAGSLVKGSSAAVYYFADDGKRYVFPDLGTYESWYSGFGSVIQVSDSQLADMPLGRLMTYRPGSKLVKITTDPKVYAVASGGVLRWVTSESIANSVYGSDWAKQVVDVPDAFFVSYSIGDPITSSGQFNRQQVRNGTPNIAQLIADQRQTAFGLSEPVIDPEPVVEPEPAVEPEPVVSAEPVTGPSIYVSLSGSDSSGDGSEANPFRTVSHAVAVADPGTAILIFPGTYSEEVRIRQSNITLTSATSTRAAIKAPLPSPSNEWPITIELDVDADGSVIRNLDISGGFYAISTQTRWDWGEPENRTGTSDVLIEGNIIHDTGRDAVKIKPNSDRITIRNNEIHTTGLSDGREDCNAEGIDNVNGDDLLVEGNYIHDACSTGVYCKGGAMNCRIIGNRFENNGAAGILIGFDTSPEYFDLGVNPGYYENIGAVVRDNLVVGSGWAGIGLYAAKDALVENNTVVDSSSVYHAPLYFGVTFQDWESYAGRPASVNPTIRNNVFYQSAGYGTLLASIRFANELGGLPGLDGGIDASGNCYYATGGNPVFEDNRLGSEYDGDLAGWAGHFSSESGSVVADPVFGENYVATSSACSGRGWRP